jgi:predicted ABC-type sugar transport system permease subunit
MDKIKDKLGKIKESGSELHKEVRERTLGYIVAAFGLVAGLAWNEAIKASIEYLFPLNQNSLLAKFIYAVVITLVVVVVSIYVIKREKKR